MIGSIDWDFIVDVLDKIFSDLFVVGILRVDDEGYDTLIGVDVSSFENSKNNVEIYWDNSTNNWVVLFEGYKYYLTDFIDVIEFIGKRFGGV